MDENTVLLLHGDGDSSSSQHEITHYGDAEYGTGSLIGDGAISFTQLGHGYLQIPDHPDFNFGTGNFTYEFWTNNTDKSVVFYSQGTGDVSDDLNQNIALRVVNETSLRLYYNIEGAHFYQNFTILNLTDGNWHHIAVVRSGENLILFFDGVQLGLINIGTGALNDSIYPLTISRYSNYLNSYHIEGALTEFRISDTARYTSNFTPSTEAFESDANTLLLIHGEGDAMNKHKVRNN